MKKILLPTDFSSCANNALDFAVQSAKILKAELTVIHVFDMAGYVYPETVGADLEYRQSLLNEVETKLQTLKDEVERREGVTVFTSVYEGAITAGILQFAVDQRIDFIVMGTSGASGIKEKLIGSETAKVIGKSKVPVLAIPFEYKWKKPEEILLATNKFEDETVIMDFLFEMAYLFSANINAIVFTNKDDKAVIVVEHTKNAFEYERMLKEQYRVEKFSVKELIGKDFENTIEEYIKQNNVDILAMVTYKKSFMDRLLHSSTAKKMSYHTKIPLLVFPGKDES